MAIIKKIYIILLLSISFSSYAAIPQVTRYLVQYNGNHYSSSMLGACSAAVASFVELGGKPTSHYIEDGRCRVVAPPNIWGWTIFEAGLTCPENSTLSGNTCSCDAGYKENTESTACIVDEPPDPCELLASACSAWSGKNQAWSKPGRSGGAWTCRRSTAVGGQDSFPGCTQGCLGENVGFDTAFQNDAGQWFSNGQARMTGSTCDPAVIENLNGENDPEYEPEAEPEPAKEPDSSCPNGFKGQVNGITVCVPPKASSGVTEMETKDNGDGTKTDTKTEVKCENGKCEVTKTSTTTNTETNTTVSNSSVTTTLDKADYCSKNKTAGACKDEQGENGDGNGKFGGSCQAGHTCEGDAVMCAMAKEQHKRNCEMLEPAKDGIWKQIEEGTDSGSADAMKGEAQQINISTQLNTSGYGLSRSCPADPVIELPFVSRSFTIPFSKACPILKTMSDVALLITALSLLIWLVAPRGKAE